MDYYDLCSLFSGWMGFVLLVAFGIATAYSASCLGTCWLILEERYHHYRIYPIPDPYPTIALHAIGRRTRYLYNNILFKICHRVIGVIALSTIGACRNLSREEGKMLGF